MRGEQYMDSKKVDYLKDDYDINFNNNLEFIVATDLHYISERINVDL